MKIGNGSLIAMTYEVEDGVEDPKRNITIKCTDADEKENKEEIPVFCNGSPPELYLTACKQLNRIETRYLWCEKGKGSLQFQHFGRAMLSQRAAKAWGKETRNQRVYTKAALKIAQAKVAEKLFGEDAYDDNLAYLRDTPMPEDWPIRELFDRIETIVGLMPYLKNGANEMSERSVITDIVSKRLPARLKKDFIMAGCDKMHTLDDVLKILTKVERALDEQTKRSIQRPQEEWGRDAEERR